MPDMLELLKGLEVVIIIYTAPNLLIGLSASKCFAEI